MKKRKASTIVIRVTITILISLFVLFIAYQFIRYLHPAYTSEICMVKKISDSVISQGLVIRDETVIELGESTNIDYLAKDGEKVAVDEPIALVFSSGNGSVINSLRNSQINSKSSLL